MLKAKQTKEWHGIKVYELPNGDIALGSGQALSALAGREKDGFAPTMRRLSAQSNHLVPLTSLPTFPVLTPEGNVARCVSVDQFTSLVELLVLAYEADELEPRDAAMGERALHMMLMYAKLGLAWHLSKVLEQPAEKRDESLSIKLNQLVQDAPAVWAKRFDEANTKAICGVYGWENVRACGPQQIRGLRASVYARLFGQDAFKALQERARASSKRMHQFLTPDAERFFETNQAVITHIARRHAGDPKGFRVELREFLDEQHANFIELSPIKADSVAPTAMLRVAV